MRAHDDTEPAAGGAEEDSAGVADLAGGNEGPGDFGEERREDVEEYNDAFGGRGGD